MDKRFLFFLVTAPGLLSAHPMGNFSVNHYSRLTVKPASVDVVYALDLAELPTFDLLRQWNLEKSSPRAALQRKVNEQGREWASHLDIALGRQPVKPEFVSAEFVIADGAGDLPILRVTSHLTIPAASGSLTYEDRNFPDRAGWKEIVIQSAAGVTLGTVSQGSVDRSKALTEYPQDPTLAPPQDVRASLAWTAIPVAAPAASPTPAQTEAARKNEPILTPVPQPKAPPAQAPATLTTKAAPPGAVVKGDLLSRLLHQKELSLGMILLAIGAAFVLGAIHALTPGHGKTIVAAYLVGSRGTLKHAAYLGAMVTFTHTVSVFLLGLATLFLFQYVMPEKITQGLGVASGLSIVAIGGWMFYKRLAAVYKPHPHAHVHAEEPVAVGAGHSHDHGHAHPHPHPHPHMHSHGPGEPAHSHDMPDQITWGSLTALAISGGLVPCESALVLLLSAIALGRVGLGLLLLIAFSLGLALVLVAIGIVVIYAKNLFPQREKKQSHPAFRWIPIGSAAIVTVIGLVMTAVSLGWLEAKWMV